VPFCTIGLHVSVSTAFGFATPISAEALIAEALAAFLRRSTR
jgi:hypothetical protein